VRTKNGARILGSSSNSDSSLSSRPGFGESTNSSQGNGPGDALDIGQGNNSILLQWPPRLAKDAGQIALQAIELTVLIVPFEECRNLFLATVYCALIDIGATVVKRYERIRRDAWRPILGRICPPQWVYAIRMTKLRTGVVCGELESPIEGTEELREAFDPRPARVHRDELIEVAQPRQLSRRLNIPMNECAGIAIAHQDEGPNSIKDRLQGQSSIVDAQQVEK
jgi:hypothetical protein